MNNLTVKSINGDYSVSIGEGTFQQLPSILEGNFEKVVIITDNNVLHFHKSRITSLQKILNANLIVLPPGERSKSFRAFNGIIEHLASNKFSRDSLIIGIGGGVIGDLSGFAASVYMRGINIIHIPTTLLSSVDSSVGGKTGINYQKVKNQIGSFYNPQLVLIDPSFLSTLPFDEFNSGMGEVIKYAFLTGGDFFKSASSLNHLKQDDIPLLCTIITTCLKFKASIVEKDEKDADLRKLLNFGHTFGHAYESASKFRIKHGNAVSLGIISSLFLSNELGIIPKDNLSGYIEVVRPFLSSKGSNFSEIEVFEFMGADKKNKLGIMNFILLKEPGTLLLNVQADKKQILKVIRKTFQV